jgi:choline-sulfatase
VGYDPELYDLDNDPEEMSNLAGKADHQDVLEKFRGQLFEILDPEAVNTQALADQKVLIESHGGVEKVLNRGGLAGTPVPGGPSTIVQVK